MIHSLRRLALRYLEFSRRLSGRARLAAYAVAVVASILVTRSLTPDPAIAGTWEDYSYGGAKTRIEQINLPAQHGATMLFLSSRDRELVPLDDHEKNWHFDDIGYAFLGQMYVLAFGPLEAAQIIWFHNALWVFSAAAIGLALVRLWESLLGGGVLFLGLLVLKAEFGPHLYASFSQHTLITVLPITFLGLLLPLLHHLRRGTGRAAFLLVLLSGMFAAAAALIRWPLGVAFMGTILAAAVLIRRELWRRNAALALTALAGFLLVYLVLPGLSAWHRDRKMGWATEFSWSYFRPPPKHKPYFVLLASVGRYPNALGAIYNDGAIDQMLVKHAVGQKYDRVFDDIARDLYVRYIREHPREYIRYLAKGCFELLWVPPAITFQHDSIFGGSPIITPAIAGRVEPHDRHPGAANRLLNLRLAYLDLKPSQWAAYGLALLMLVAGSAWELRHWRKPAAASAGMVAVLWLYLTLLAFPRALIPPYGQDFAVLFWALAGLTSVWSALRFAAGMVPVAQPAAVVTGRSDAVAASPLTQKPSELAH